MIRWINYNQQVRDALVKYFNLNKAEYECTDELFLSFQIDIFSLQFENKEWYKYIIGLAFVDQYLLLKDKEKNNKLNERNVHFLKRCLAIENIEQLLSTIENNDEFLSQFVFSLLDFNKLSVKERGLLFANNIDMKFIAKFSPLTCLEKEYYCQDESTESLLKEYMKKTMANSDDNLLYFTQNKIIEENNFVDKIFLKSKLNPDNFETLVRQMISTIYKREKYILNCGKFHAMFPIALKLISLVESNDLNMIEEIKNDRPLYNYVAHEFLHYSTELINFSQRAEAEYFYANYVDNAIKDRLEDKTKKKEM